MQGARPEKASEELWMEVGKTVREAVTKTYPKKKKHEKAMWLSEEAYKYLRSGKQGRKGKTAPPECRVPEKSKER